MTCVEYVKNFALADSNKLTELGLPKNNCSNFVDKIYVVFMSFYLSDWNKLVIIRLIQWKIWTLYRRDKMCVKMTLTDIIDIKNVKLNISFL